MISFEPFLLTAPQFSKAFLASSKLAKGVGTEVIGKLAVAPEGSTILLISFVPYCLETSQPSKVWVPPICNLYTCGILY